MTKRTPVNLITGFLGVGKTTAIRHWLAHKPAGEYWAVVVNEFGEVGIDGAAMSSDTSGVQVAEVPGGCICCITSPLLKVTLTRLLRQKPDRILIEPSGLGHPAGILDILQDPFLAPAMELRATLCLLDARQFDDSRYNLHDTWRDQLQLADVVVLNKADRADAPLLSSVQQRIRAMFPPKLAVVTAIEGQIDLSLLDCDLQQDRRNGVAIPLAHQKMQPALLPVRQRSRAAPVIVENIADVVRKPNQGNGRQSMGWILAPHLVFSSQSLSNLFYDLGQQGAGQIEGLERAKAVVHTDKGWFLFNWVNGERSLGPVSYRRDSRIELIANVQTAPDWVPFESALLACLLSA